MANRRKIRNILLEPRLQFRYAFRFFVFSALSIGAIQLVSYFLIRNVIERILTEAGPQAQLLSPVIDLAVRTELLHAAWMLPLVCIAALAFTSRILHRFIGPVVPITRHVERLAAGDYGVELQTRQNDEMQDVAASLNKLSEVLATRHPRAPRVVNDAEREAGFSLVELLVVLALVMIIGMLAVSQFLTAYDRSRQRGTLADLRTLASANGTYSVDHGDYSSTLEGVAPYYLGTIPPVDRWGYAWEYSYVEGTYELSSKGSDGAVGPEPPQGWTGDPFECDLIVENGSFMQAPATSG